MRPLSILFVAVRFPLPLRTGDRARAYHQIRLLARRHRVTLATFLDESPSARAARADIEALGVRVVSVPFGRRAAAWRVARRIVGAQPLQVALYDAPALRAGIAALLREERFDLVHVQLARAATLVPPDAGIPVFLDFVDALSLNMARRAAHDRWPTSWIAALEARRLAAYERTLCARLAAGSVVSAADRAALGDPPCVGINGNGVDLAAFPFVTDGRDPRHLVFSGNLGYFPNVEAVTWIVQQVLPLIWRTHADTRLTIAGARPHARVRALTADARVTLAADVPNMHPHLARAAVAMAPMFIGSGQLLKVLEAMASGAPVVATTRALNGLDAMPGVHALVADTPEDFARATTGLLDDPVRAQALAGAARALVASTCTWERSVDDLERRHAALVDARVATVA